MATRKEINDLCRLRLGDVQTPYQFSDLQINQWINDALAELSHHLPRVITAALSTAAGQQEYDLGDFPALQAVLRVEYPLGAQPPRYLTRRQVTERRGFWGQAVYDVRHGALGGLCLVIGLTPQDGEQIRLTLQCDQAVLTADEDEASLPKRELELVVLFVRLAGMQEQLARRCTDTEPSSLLLSALSENIARAQREYQDKLKTYLLAQDVSRRVSWTEGDGV